MKKIFVIFSAVLAVALVVPMFAAVAQTTVPNGCHLKVKVNTSLSCEAKGTEPGGSDTTGNWCPIGAGDPKNADCGMCCFIQTVNNITDWVFYVMTAIAVLLFVYGGIVYMTAMGEPEKASKGSRIIIYAILGLVIALIAKIVPDIVTTLVR